MKRLLSILGFSIAGSLSLWAQTETNHLLGDMNHDGVITIADVTALVDIVAEKTPPEKISILDGQVFVKPTNISLNQEEVILTVGETQTLTAKIVPALTTDQTIIWTSSDNTIAIVSTEGVVTGVAKGEVTITAKSKSDNNISAECAVKVNPARVTSLTLDKTSVELAPNEQVTLVATPAPSYASDYELVWSSSDTDIATVSDDGTVTAISDGSVTITVALSDDATIKATCEVEVKSIPVTSITLSKTSVTMEPEEHVTLFVSLAPANASDCELTWTSSNSAVATVDNNGHVTAIAEGTAIITVAVADNPTVNATCEVTVKKPDPEDDYTDIGGETDRFDSRER